MFIRKYINYIEYLNDSLQNHREKLPAIEYSNGSKYWHLNGMKHRDNLPAVITSVYKAYFQYDKCHRINYPAIEYINNGYKAYYQNDLPHNPNGPAIIRSDGNEEYYLYGHPIQKEDLNKDKNYLKLKYDI